MKGLEPPRLTAPDPKSGSATNYDTSAFRKSKRKVNIFLFLKKYLFSVKIKCFLLKCLIGEKSDYLLYFYYLYCEF